LLKRNISKNLHYFQYLKYYRFCVPSYTGYRDIIVNIKINLPSSNDIKISDEYAYDDNESNIANTNSIDNDNDNNNDNDYYNDGERIEILQASKLIHCYDKKYDKAKMKKKYLICEIQIHHKEILNFSKKIRLQNLSNQTPNIERTQYISSYDLYLHFRNYFYKNKNNVKQHKIRIKVLEKMNQIYGSPDSLEKFIKDFFEVNIKPLYMYI
jgi:hypothetical protein